VFSSSLSSTLTLAAVHGEVVLEEASEVDLVDLEAQAMDPVVQDLDLKEDSALADLKDRLVVMEASAPAVKVASEENRVDLALVVDSAPAVKVASVENGEVSALAVDSAPVVKVASEENREVSAPAEDSAPVVKEASEENREDSAPVVMEDSPDAKEGSALVVQDTAQAVASVPADREVLVREDSAPADMEDSALVVKDLGDTLVVLPATVAK